MTSPFDAVEIVLLGNPRKPGEIDGMFVLQASTIRAFPNSLLAEKLALVQDDTNQVFIERNKRQFKRVRQLMVYKDWTRIENMSEVERDELEEDLKYYRLEEFFRYLRPYTESDEQNRRFLFAKKYVFPSNPRRPLVLIWIEHDHPRYRDWFKSFNYNKYDVVHGLALEPDNLDMFLYGIDRKKIIYLNVVKKKLKEIEGLFFTFLLAVERYEFRQKLFVGRKDFEAFPEIKIPDKSI